jgi:hypothetical protein
MKFLKHTLIFSLLLFGMNDIHAQSGACGLGGTYLNYNDYVNYDRSSGGDLEVDLTGYLEIGPEGLFDIYGAVINNGIIEVDSGGQLTIYGDMLNNGSLIARKGSIINFFGNTWKNGTSATVSDGALPNTIPGGDLSFIAARPSLPPSWLVVSPCLTTYSGGNALQFADGGNIPMDVTLRLQNANNVVLINTPTRIEGKLQWDVANGDIVLGNQDLILTNNATQDGFREDRFAITNGTGHLVKENYLGNWIYPVGITDGDYTPAAIDNTSANTMHVLVQNYATSASDEALTGAAADGMDRTWNIYADIATGNSNIKLQHNSITNQPLFSDAYNFVTRWSSAAPNFSGDYAVGFSTSAWQSNFAAAGLVGNLSSAGTVTGSNMRSRVYTDFATNPFNEIAFYTKSSDPFHPLPVELVSFSGQAKDCGAIINFTTGSENSINKFNLQRSIDGRFYTTIATIEPKGSNSSYSYVDENAKEGLNLYRLSIIEPSGDYILSSVIQLNVTCKQNNPKLNLYPNPADEYIVISGMTSNSSIRIINMMGRVVSAISSNAPSERIDISQLASATYVAQIILPSNEIIKIKFIKK